MKVTILVFFLFCSSVVYAQDQLVIDSLQTELKNFNAKKLELGKNAPALLDTTAANILYELSKAFWYNFPDTAIVLATRSKAISEKLEYKKGEGFALYSIGVSYVYKLDFFKALEYTNYALKLGQAIGNKKLIASAYTNLGVVNSQKANYPEAVINNLAAIEIASTIGDKQILEWNYGNLAFINNSLGNFKEALKYSFKALEIAEKSDDKFAIVGDCIYIGSCYSGLGQYADAITYQQKALEVSMEIRDEIAISQSYYNLGLTYDKQGNYNEALKFYYVNLECVKRLEDKLGMGYVYTAIGEVYIKKKNYLKAIEYLNIGLKISKEIGALEVLKYNYEALSKVYSQMAVLPSLQSQKKADYALKALENYKLYIACRDSIINSEGTKKITQLEMQFDFDKKEAATKAEQDKKHALAAAEIQKQKLVRNFSFAGIFVLLLIGGYGFYRLRENKKIENQQALLNERLRISRELHDDMGSTLSSISVYSEVAKNRAAKNENETEVLQKIGTASRELIEKMSDIVWSLNPNNENFEQLKNRMMAFAAMMLTPKGMLFEFDIDDEVKSTAIAPEQRKNIFLIYKEAINNIVKYSEAKEVRVSIKVKEKKLSLVILDNGVGFDSLSFGEGRGEVYNGNGLKNMKARAAEIKALFNVTSRINEGVKIELTFNI
jgi:signal transduction histidine kinase